MTCIATGPLQDVAFSSCGNMVKGCDLSTDATTTCFIDVSTMIGQVSSQRVPLRMTAETDLQVSTSLITQQEPSVAVLSGNPYDAFRPAVHKPNTITFGRSDQGIASISCLKQLQEEGALVLTTLQKDGNVRVENLSRLPRDFDLSEAVVATNAEGEPPDSIRIIFNVKQKVKNSLLEKHRAYPVILERKRKSISTFERRVSRKLDFSSTTLRSLTKSL